MGKRSTNRIPTRTRVSKRQKTTRFTLTMDDYDQNDINFSDTSSIISDNDGMTFSDDDDPETDDFTSLLNENNPKQGSNAPSKSANGNGKSKLVWGNVNQKLGASYIPFNPIKIQKTKMSRKSLPEEVAMCFQTFFTSEMLDILTASSNAYAESKSKEYSWAEMVSSKKISKEEMLEYLGIRLAQGIIRCSEHRDIYCESFPHNFQAFKVMAKSRFEIINSALHCGYKDVLEQSSDHTTISTTVQHPLEAVTKVGTFLKTFRDVCHQCPKYEISRELTLDEMMVRFQGRSALVYHRQPKPTSVGMKVISLTDPNGFLIDFLVLEGPGKSKPIHECVMQLTSQLPKGHVVYMDNYYGSIKTALSLLENDVMCCCTLRKN